MSKNLDKFDEIFLTEVYDLLDEYPNVKYKIDPFKHAIKIDTQGDLELDKKLAEEIYSLMVYWGVEDAWAV